MSWYANFLLKLKQNQQQAKKKDRKAIVLEANQKVVRGRGAPFIFI